MNSFSSLRQYEGYYDALNDYLHVPQKMYEGENQPIPDSPYEIRFENVSFRYAGQRTFALKNVSLTLRSGEKLSIIGENGAGKTTFVKLLCRLYDPTEGRITLNGTDIRDINYDAYLGIMCAVFQDYKLLAFTLEENIAFQHAETEDAETIERIIKRVGLGTRLETLPHRTRTHIYKIFSEEGFEPSGGEGQKIALARAIYKDAPVMILDEPTRGSRPPGRV